MKVQITGVKEVDVAPELEMHAAMKMCLHLVMFNTV